MQKISNQQLNRPTPEQYAQQPRISVVVVLDNIRSAQNIGAFFRTCDAFAIRSIALCGITATPPSKDIHKSALGAEMTVEWQHFDSTIECLEELHNQGYKSIAIEQVEGAVMLDKYRFQSDEKYALIFGNEVMGVDQTVVDKCHQAVEIPQMGSKHSINVSVAGGVVLWRAFEDLKSTLTK
ncbi:MAG: RNA methyltransferase [Rikenellaceae bacterium]